MDEIFVPVLHHFENGNVFTGSFGNLRFILKPHDYLISASVWYGPFCLEKSEIADTADFPLTEAGRDALCAWLDAHKDGGTTHDER